MLRVALAWCSSIRLRRIFVAMPLLLGTACGIDLDVASGASADTNSQDSTASSSSGGGSSGATNVCAAAFQLDIATACDGGASTCLGQAAASGSELELTTFAASSSALGGIYWRRLDLATDMHITLEVLVTTQQPEGGGIQGHGFALSFVQADADAAEFPGFLDPATATVDPGTYGISALAGFHGSAAYVKTYDGGVDGVFALHATAIPSGSGERVDDYESGVDNAERFGRSDRTWLRIVVDGAASTGFHVELFRRASDEDRIGVSIQTLDLDTSTLTHLDYFGLSATRGNDEFSQSGERIQSTTLSCPTGT